MLLQKFIKWPVKSIKRALSIDYKARDTNPALYYTILYLQLEKPLDTMHGPGCEALRALAGTR